MKMKKRYKKNAIEILKAILIIAAIPCFLSYKYCGIEKRKKFTVGYTYGRYSRWKKGEYVKYYFVVNRDTFKSSQKYNTTTDVKGINGKYLVKFDSTSPDWNVFYLNVPVPDTLIISPLSSWSSLPPYLDSLYKKGNYKN
jgi:hypothetical protein